MGRLFGTDGVRGVLNKELTPELALRLGLAIGSFFQEGSRILLGRDARSGGDMLARIVAGALTAAGVRVYDAGLTPTPALQYIVKNDGFDGGVMITASHNPREYNGIKVIAADGIEIPRDKEREIEEIFFQQRYRRVDWRSLSHETRPYPGVNEKYVYAVISHVDKELISRRGFKVLIDPANSVGALTSPWVAKLLGAKPITLNGHLDPWFPGRNPEPTPDTLTDTAKAVKALGADLGIAHDGDADRAIIIDDMGRVQWGDRTAALLTRFLAEKHPDLPRRVYTAISSSIVVEEVLREHGIKVVWMKVGSVDISRRLAAEGGLAGFEENGGFMYPLHHPVRDGAMTLALMLQLMAEEKTPLSQLYDQLPQYHLIKTKIPMTRDKALKVVEKVKEAFRGAGEMITIDGVRVNAEDYWFLVRPSGTEPLLRIMLEAKTREKAEALLAKIKSIAEEVLRE